MKKEIGFYICLIISICLLVGGFFVPPMAVIDGSVLEGCGILFGFATLAQIPVIVTSAKTVKVQHGNTIIEATRKEKEGEQEEKKDGQE